MTTARAFWITGERQAEIRTTTLAGPEADEVLIDTRYSAISRGTETLVYDGRVPPSEYRRMRAPFQEGAFPSPIKYGYCNVGVVRDGPDTLVGRTVFTLFPHQTAFVVPAAAVTPVPASVPDTRAVLAANLETAVNAIWDSGVSIGDRVTVVGGGTVGCLCAWLAGRIAGTDVELVDTDPARDAVARALGVGFRLPDDAGNDRDLVLHASGSDAGLATAIGLAGFEATIVELSWYGSGTSQVPLGGRFHSNRLTLKASQVGHVAARQRSRWDHRRRMDLVMRLLADPALDALVTEESHFDDLPRTMAAITRAGTGALCHRINYR